MNDKSKRRMSIVLIDKKGKSQEILRDDMNNSNIIDIKEEKGAETINTSNKRREMDNKEKICKCEMCNKDKSKCETCKKNKNCDCKSNRSSISSISSTVSTVSTVRSNRSNIDKKKSNGSMISNKNNKDINNKPPNKNKDINNLVLNQNGFNSIDKKISDSMRNREGSSKDKSNESIKSIDKQMDYKSINDSINSINSDSIKNLNLVDNKKGNDSIKRESIKNDTFGSTQNAGNMSDNMNASRDMSASRNKSNGSMNKGDMNKGNTSMNKDTGSLKKGLAAGAVAGAGAGIVLGKSAQEEKKIKESEPQTNENKTVSLREDENNSKAVTIDENQNKEYSITRDPNKSLPLNEEEKQTGKSHTTKTLFVPPVISDENLPEDSEIRKERENNNVVGEGHMWKRRRIFACFWHEKYFVLTKEGILKYHKANGTKYSKGNWDLKKANRIHEVFLGAERHPYRLALVCDEDNLLFGYDDPDTREYWYNQFSKFIDF